MSKTTAKKTEDDSLYVSAPSDVEVLHRLGASYVAEVLDEKTGSLIGYEVRPKIDISGYKAALSELQKERLDIDKSSAREERTRRLAATDWTQLPDVPSETAERWRPYRQQLRDLDFSTTPDIKWPKEPA